MDNGQQPLVINRVDQYADIMFFFPSKILYFTEIEAANGSVYCAYKEQMPIGIICLKELSDCLDIAYIFVKESYRRCGVANCLVKYTTSLADSAGIPLKLRVVENSQADVALTKIANKLKMSRCGQMISFGFCVDDETRRVWTDERPKMVDLAEKVARRYGSQRVLTFAEATPELLSKIRTGIGQEFSELDPFTLPDFDPTFSVIVVRESDFEPLAFNAVRTIGRKMIYEISSAKSGFTLVAGVSNFFDRLFASDIEYVTSMVHTNNRAGMLHASKRFGLLFKERGLQTVYMRFPNR